jgi:Skp family chaperone for outer membrane proteins
MDHKKEEDELKESYKQSVRNKKERDVVAELPHDKINRLEDEIRIVNFRNEKLHGLIERMQKEYASDMQELINTYESEITKIEDEMKALKRKFVPDLETIAGVKEQVPENDIRAMDRKRRESYARRWEKNDKKNRYSDEWIRKNILDNKDLT